MTPEQQEELALSKVRNVGLDVLGTMHVIDAFHKKKDWTCECLACQYVRAEPRLVRAIIKNLNKQV